MKKISINNKLALFVLILIFIVSILYDLFRFYSTVEIPTLEYASEFLMALGIYVYYRFVLNALNLSDKSIKDSLKFFVTLIGLLYASVIILKIIFNPSFNPAVFPQPPDTLGTVLYSNLISAIAVIFLIPMLIIIKQLIFYKQKKSSILLLNLLLVFATACAVLTVILKEPLNFTLSGNAIYNNILLIISLVLILLISFRNSWITYLSRKEKITYFFISLFAIWAVLFLFDYAFAVSVASHSLFVGAFANLAWFMMVFYVITSSFYMLMHLPTARVFDKKLREISSLHNLSREVSTEFDFNRLVKLITTMVSEVLDSESTWLELVRDNPNSIYIASSQNLTGDHIELFDAKNRQSISETLLKNKQAILVNSFTKNHPLYKIKSWKEDIDSLICAPLVSGSGKAIGLLFASKNKIYGFDPDDLAMLEAYANQATIALENSKLLIESLERERLEQELKIARDVQQKLLPQSIPEIKDLEIESLTITAYEVGGDYYDFFSLPDKKLGIVIGDVSGKGTSAAFYMAEAKGVMQSLCRTYFKPKELLINANKILYDSMERNMFITMLAATLDEKNKSISFARAGHCPVLHYCNQSKKIQSLQPPGIGIGLEEGIIFAKTLTEQNLPLNKGDILVFFTDGLSEARNSEGIEYGEERLREIIKNNCNNPVIDLKETIIDSILGFLDGYNLADDLTLVLIKVQ